MGGGGVSDSGGVMVDSEDEGDVSTALMLFSLAFRVLMALVSIAMKSSDFERSPSKENSENKVGEEKQAKK